MPTNDFNIYAKIRLDISNIFGNRFTIFEIQYPRIIMAEVNTHRMLSKVSASSRAIPINKQIEKVKTNPFIPSYLGKNKSGMQASEELDDESILKFKREWLSLADEACNTARKLEALGVHKQITNRVLEPFSYVKTLIAGTEFANLFKLRAHKDAQPEFMLLASKMLEEYISSVPITVTEGWHGAFMDRMPPGTTEEERKKIMVARAARISYDNFDGEIKKEDDIRLHDQLLESKHMSPFEFVVYPSKNKDFRYGNLDGFIQYRKTIKGECAMKIDHQKIYDKLPDWAK